MVMNGLIQVFMLWIEFLSIVVLSLTIFRISFAMYWKKTAIISLVMALVSFYVRDVMSMFNYSVPLVIIAYVTLTVILFRLPILYSLLVCVTGYFAQAIIQVALVMAGMSLGFTSVEQINNSLVHASTVSMTTASMSILLSWFLMRRKLGFMFVSRRFQGKQAIQGYNFVLVALLFLLIVTIQLGVLSFDISHVHIYLIVGMVLLFITAIAVSFHQNRKLLRERYK